MPLTPSHLDKLRAQFPALARQVNGHAAAYFDGPGGTQTPQCVIDAVSHYLAHLNANHEGRFATSRESDELLDKAHRAAADFVGSDDPDTVAFGPNMTTLTMSLSRSLARTWKAGDEVIVTRLDHDANYSPWTLAAADAGAEVKVVEFSHADCTLDLEQYRSLLSDRTKLVAIGCASNAVGTLNPVKEMIQQARSVGATVFLDAVHYAPHALIDVVDWDCDFLACSAYKFFGPHVGMLWGRRELLDNLFAYKLRPAADSLPGKWMTGTQNHEGLAGALAAIDYIADLGREASGERSLGRREALVAAYSAIAQYENQLCRQLMDGLRAIDGMRIWGVDDDRRMDQRLPTLAVTHPNKNAAEIADFVGARGCFVWDGHYYAINLTEELGLEPHGMVRIGLVHYNTSDEVDRLLTALSECVG